jgi:hypothetical protein
MYLREKDLDIIYERIKEKILKDCCDILCKKEKTKESNKHYTYEVEKRKGHWEVILTKKRMKKLY